MNTHSLGGRESSIVPAFSTKAVWRLASKEKGAEFAGMRGNVS